MALKIKRCPVCGGYFPYRRETAVYCSNSCKARAQRGDGSSPVSSSAVSSSAEKPVRLDVDDCLDLVMRLKNAATDLSRMAAYAPPGLRVKFRHLAKGVMDLLAAQGL